MWHYARVPKALHPGLGSRSLERRRSSVGDEAHRADVLRVGPLAADGEAEVAVGEGALLLDREVEPTRGPRHQVVDEALGGLGGDLVGHRHDDGGQALAGLHLGDAGDGAADDLERREVLPAAGLAELDGGLARGTRLLGDGDDLDVAEVSAVVSLHVLFPSTRGEMDSCLAILEKDEPNLECTPLKIYVNTID